MNTNKIDLIKAEVEKLKSQLLRGACSYQITMETCCKEEAYDKVLAILDIMQEESVSEELEKASKEWLASQLDKSYANYGEAKMMELTHFDGYAMLDAIEFGSQWKEQQMMAKAVDGVITFDYYGDDDKTYGCIAHDSFCLEDFGLKDTDKVKMILIKE